MKIGYLMQKGEEIRQAPFNGPANHVRQVSRHLQRLGHEVRILFRLDGSLWITGDLEKYRRVHVPQSEAGAPHFFERAIRRFQSELRLPYLAFFESQQFAQACRQELADCDVFLERMSWMTYGGALAARKQKIPLVLEYNGDPIADLKAKGELPQGIQYSIASRIMGRAMRAADHLVATGDGWRKNCIEQWQIRPDKITTIENGTALVEILSRNQLRSFSENADPRAPVTLVYLGGFYAWHGISVLINALAQAVQTHTALRLLLIGSGRGEAEARKQVQDMDLSNRVEFLGQMVDQDFAEILAKADIGLSPYCGWPEYSGLKLFDYKAAGLAVIASGEDGKPTTLRHGETGWIVPPCDENALSAAIIRLSCDAGLRQKLGRQARIEAEASHGWDQTARQLEQVLQQVIA